MSLLAWVAVAALGSLGALGRWLLETLLSARSAIAFPIGTLTINTTGALLLGLIAGLALTGEAFVLVGAGLIGSYTTFSTWMFETHRLAAQGRRRAAAFNVAISVALGISAVALGRAIGGWL